MNVHEMLDRIAEGWGDRAHHLYQWGLGGNLPGQGDMPPGIGYPGATGGMKGSQ